MTEAPNVHYFQFGTTSLAYRRFGHGQSILLAFHGFGQTGQVFLPLEKTLGEQYTILAVDLFFHGNSHYESTQLLTKADWQRLMDAFLRSQLVTRFSLMGFSLGGRFALTTVEAFADQLDQVILIAPDGITRNLWYWLATASGIGRKLFQYVLRHLSMLNAFGHALTQLGLLNRTIMRFAEISLSTPERRKLVYKAWTQFRLIRPDLTAISNLLATRSIRVLFFTGAYDRVVPGNYILPLAKQLRQYELTVLKTGHNHLIELVADELVQKP